MKKAVMLLSCALALLLFLPSAHVGDSPAALSVHFDVDTTIPEDVTQATFGPFIATGPAADAGIICPSGDTIDVVYWESGFHTMGRELTSIWSNGSHVPMARENSW